MSLSRIALRDFVLVVELDLELADDFTVLSGETGAGKSILIDALQLALGARAETGCVRDGAQRAEIVAEFEQISHTRSFLDEHGFEHDDVLLLRRVIDRQGRSRAWINGSAATLSQLRAVGDMLVDIHGQHAWQSLMHAHSVRQLFDAFAQINRTDLDLAWQTWRSALNKLELARENAAQNQIEKERLQWQLEEVGKLTPQLGQWEELNLRHTRLSNSYELQASATQALALLDGDVADADSASHSIMQATYILEQQASIEPEFSELLNSLHTAQANVQEVARSLRQYTTNVDSEGDDASELADLDSLISQWLGLARRFKRQPEELPTMMVQWQDELNALDADSDEQFLREQEALAQREYRELAESISRQRKQAAPLLSNTVSTAMQELGMQGGRFEVRVERLAQPAVHGIDDVQFLIANAGATSFRALHKVASGGELSRISLAIAVATSGLGQQQTLIFDEVDSGIGGAVAETVGKLLRRLGRTHQVLAVTHLPQVAACAKHHLLVSKKIACDAVSSSVQAISGTDRSHEIARMLGGELLTEATIIHAQEMLELSNEESTSRPILDKSLLFTAARSKVIPKNPPHSKNKS